jgi:Membrane protein involved in the export of O-antigen and teichoic acid
MDKISKIIKSTIFKNGMWLYMLQIFNTVIPLVTIPYITRILGSSEYGVFSFSLNIVSYLQVIVEYGFVLSGSRKISIDNDKSHIANIYSNIMCCRMLLCILSFASLLVVGQCMNFSEKQTKCMLILFLMVTGTAFQQIWLFQGVQKMHYIAIAGILARTISVACIFLFIHSPNDIYFYCLYYAVTNVIIGIAGTLFARFMLGIRFHLAPIGDVILELKDGWYTFTTSMMSKIFTGIGVTVLGIYGTNSQVGVYSAIQKVPLLLSFAFAPIGQIIYPYVSPIYYRSFSEGQQKVKKIAKYILIPFVFGGIIIVVFSNPILSWLFGPEYAMYSAITLPLILWMLTSICNNFLGIQTLVAGGFFKQYSFAFNIGVVTMLLLNFLLGRIFNIYGIAWAAFISEFILSCMLSFQIGRVTKTTK